MIVGLLEQSALLLLPGASAGGSRPLMDAAQKAVLGFACWRGAGVPAWLSWLTRPVLEVHETDDEPLLLTIQCPWLLARTWEVFDADEHPVGAMYSSTILDRFGRPWAVVGELPEGDHRFTTPEGTELGLLTRLAAGSRLTFAPAVAGDPFAKMLVLAGALALTGNSRT